MSRVEVVEAGEAKVRVRVERASDALVGEIARRVAKAAKEERVLAELVELDGERAWLKGDHLPGKARVRHSLAALASRATPRERELERLLWMRARLFCAPEPLCAGHVRANAVLRYQFLAMAPLGPHEPLEIALRGASADQRAAWIDELARETARMHALHFVHRNLFFRNVVVDRSPPPEYGDPRRLVFLDPWRGGAALPRRGVAYDLGALMLDAAGAWSSAEQHRFFELYFAERSAQDRPARPDALLPAAARRRSGLQRRAPRHDAVEWRWRDVLASLRRA